MDVAEVHLPGELLGLIIGSLDKGDIKQCTLLSHHWRASSRPVLFRAIVLRPQILPASHGQECTSGCDTDNAAHNRLKAFHQFLQYEDYGDVAALIKDITVGDRDGPLWLDLFVSDIDPVLARLPSLESVCFTSIILHPCLPGFSLTGWRNPRPLTRLSLDFMALYPPSWATTYTSALVVDVPDASDLSVDCCFIDLLNMFSAVKQLHLMDVQFNWPGLDSPYSIDLVGRYWHNPPLARAAGRTLMPTFSIMDIVSDIDAVYTHADLFSLLECAHFPDLRSLAIKDWECVQRAFLGRAGHTLTYLHITVDVRISASFHELLPDEYNLGCCRSLKSLRITIPMYLDPWIDDRVDSNEFEEEYGRLLNVVKSSPTNLKDLLIDFEYSNPVAYDGPGPAYLEALDWATLDKTLVSRAGLKRVTVQFRYSCTLSQQQKDWWSAFREEMEVARHGLPQVNANNRLRLRTEPASTR
ncbi:hypothetical protein EIP91_000925 [Steccherinum ochraceum]|uniref:F-box domain-containing protein n=1 Tax=Steccherinum ochraceum TaxID=92696 RepID=A0A4R0RNG4_9APHY|nr:hypothetical protein EIP91_000925 [Steccherinum ochraceum]